MDILSEFKDGIDDYFAGELPKGWDKPERRALSPYLTGWYMASEADNYGDDYFSRKGK